MTGLPRTLEPEVMDTAEEAEDYDTMDHGTVNRLFVNDLLEFLNAHSAATDLSTMDVVDLGTGTALIPLELLSRPNRFRSVVACDLSVEMLKIARQNLTDAEQHFTILPTFCDAKRLPMADRSCGIVMSNSIVHHIPDPADVFREIRRVVRYDGVLFIRDLMRPDTAEQVEELVEIYAGDENEHQKQMFRQSLHAALRVEEVADLLRDVGFPAQWVTATSDRHWTIAGRM